jgi:mRNA interferase RelE/StbE
MRVFQSGSFARSVKKLDKQQKKDLDSAIRKIMQNPVIGAQKKGDLRGVFVHKFKIRTTPYLLSYRIAGDDLELIMVGPHENYYRDMKSYWKDR